MDNHQTINIKPLEFLFTNIMSLDDMIFDYIPMYFQLENMKENIIGKNQYKKYLLTHILGF